MANSERPKRDETEHERLDRQLIELLQGFRVAVTGVQVLFAFLLTVPYAARFHEVDGVGKWLFYVALFAAALASICFIAPVIQHRILFQAGQKALLIRRANRFGIVAAVGLAVSITASTTLIIESLTNGWAAWATVLVIGLLTSWVWFVQPVLTRRAADRHPERRDGEVAAGERRTMRDAAEQEKADDLDEAAGPRKN
ncbi:DUF6328 family protein [Actinomadura parmotrematis]|uniref:Amine oxidase n=1 Tax=Actinomadura parmotrematis TaxID=2864039 RepID=A0ABS7FZD7_9ACTN|nr:DUF6328 family protein [Actinomadura parmotrematis]MBW8485810.1 hypothetical protein [Actinomadura parmotrematis]